MVLIVHIAILAGNLLNFHLKEGAIVTYRDIDVIDAISHIAYLKFATILPILPITRR